MTAVGFGHGANDAIYGVRVFRMWAPVESPMHACQRYMVSGIARSCRFLQVISFAYTLYFICVFAQPTAKEKTKKRGVFIFLERDFRVKFKTSVEY